MLIHIFHLSSGGGGLYGSNRLEFRPDIVKILGRSCKAAVAEKGRTHTKAA